MPTQIRPAVPATQIPGQPTSPVPGGPAGLSAYQIALKNGFTGNEAQWLASLQGGAVDPGDITLIFDNRLI